MIPQSFIQDLLARTDIVDIISRHLPLKKSGANYFSCCPFHEEKSASFSVSPAKQFYYCFGCGAKGNAIGFLMAYSGLDYVAAIRELAGQLGLQVPEDASVDFAQARAQLDEREQLLGVMRSAAQFYQQQLRQSPQAVAYLKRRGLTGEIARRFGMGYAPDQWQALNSVFGSYDSPLLVEAGLVIEKENSRYDRFRDRIMFPISGKKGEIVGFGGRVLEKGDPKYLNSPQTPLFDKSSQLYGLTEALQDIHAAHRAVVVEGYMDVVALAQHGIGYAVATLGTATTPQHLKQLLRQTQRIVFCFDGDQAGQRAAWRALEASLEVLRDDAVLQFLFLPPEHDPDSFVRSEGAQAFVAALDDALSLSDFMQQQLVSRCQPQTSAEGRARLVHEAKALVLRIAAPMLKLQMIKSIASLCDMTQQELETAWQIRRAPRSGGNTAVRQRAVGQPPRPAGRRPHPPSAMTLLLRLVMHHPVWALRIPVDLVSEDSPEGRALTAIIDLGSIGELEADCSMGALVELFRGTEHEALLARLAGGQIDAVFDEAVTEDMLEDTLYKIQLNAVTARIDTLTALEREQKLTSEQRRQLAELLLEKNRLSKSLRRR